MFMNAEKKNTFAYVDIDCFPSGDVLKALCPYDLMTLGNQCQKFVN